MSTSAFLHTRTGIGLCCAGLVVIIGIGYLFVAGLLFVPADDYHKIIPLADIQEDVPFYTDWNGDTLLILKPASARLQRLPANGVEKNTDVVDPPVRTDRHRFPYKVFLLERHRGFLMLGLKRWYSNQIPCYSLRYVTATFDYRDRQLAGGLKCTGSLNEWWEQQLVFDVLGRSQSRYVPDLYMPHYDLTRKEIIVGKRSAP